MRGESVSQQFLLVGKESAQWTCALDRALSPMGSMVVVREDEAVTAVIGGIYDLVIIDAGAVRNMWSVRSRVQAQSPEVHMVIATASPTWQRAREVMRAGAANYIYKSLEESELRTQIESVLGLEAGTVGQEGGGPMPRATIALADNALDFCRTRAEFLEQEGYRVLPAATPTEARRLLERGGIDLAILDIRLENDDDEKDTSGLLIAQEIARNVPKIMLTAFPSVEGVIAALRPRPDGVPAAIDFIAKTEGPEALLRAVRRCLQLWPPVHREDPFNLAVLQELIETAFTTAEMWRFCRDRSYFRPVEKMFATDDGLEAMADKLIDYSRRHVLLAELVAEVRKGNPRQYERFAERLYNS